MINRAELLKCSLKSAVSFGDWNAKCKCFVESVRFVLTGRAFDLRSELAAEKLKDWCLVLMLVYV